jgi:PAS domain S-box-containing protein
MPKRKTPRSKSAKPSKPVAHTPLALCDKLIPTQARRQQLELICQALEPLPDAVSITDPKQNRFLYVNPAWLKLFRYTPAEALHQQARILNLSDESDKLIDTIITATRNGGWSGRVLNQDKHQHIFPVQLRTRTLFDSRQKVIGLLGISTSDRPPALGPEQIQAIIDAQTAALHQTLGRAGDTPHAPVLDPQSGKAPNLKILSTREREIFLLIGHGLTPTQIADRLHLSIHTIHAHRANIRTKLDSPDSPTLTYWAIHWVDQGGLPQ